MYFLVVIFVCVFAYDYLVFVAGFKFVIAFLAGVSGLRKFWKEIQFCKD